MNFNYEALVYYFHKDVYKFYDYEVFRHKNLVDIMHLSNNISYFLDNREQVKACLMRNFNCGDFYWALI